MSDKNKHILTILIASILIVLVSNLNIDNYLKIFTIPFTLMIISYLIILKDKSNNKKAYYFLIPISLILLNTLFISNDISNKILNYVVISILISTIFHSLTNKNFNIKQNYLTWIFKIFPKRLITNLNQIKPNIKENSKLNSNTIQGIAIGSFIGIIIYALLINADQYFSNFMTSIFKKINTSNILLNIIIFLISFIILNSVVINIINNKSKKLKESSILKIDKSIITPILIIINTIFVLFLLSELSKLTTNFLELPVKYTYASYAREGFFQLLFVTIINFIIVLFIKYKTTLIEKFNSIKYLIIALISFTIILIANSFYRMYLYINSYNLTILRAQVILFLLMELIIFILLIFNLRKQKNNSLLYFILGITTYIINLYICNEQVINKLNELIFK